MAKSLLQKAQALGVKPSGEPAKKSLLARAGIQKRQPEEEQPQKSVLGGLVSSAARGFAAGGFTGALTGAASNLLGNIVTAPKTREVAKNVGKAMIANERGLGESISAGIFGNSNILENAEKDISAQEAQTLQRIKEKRAAGEDTTRLEKSLKQVSKRPRTTIEKVMPAVNKTNKQVLGEAAGVATDILSAGTIPKGVGGPSFKLVSEVPSVFGGAVKSTGILKGAAEGAAKGAGSGALFGAMQGAARSAQEDKSGEEIIGDAAKGAGFGLAAGGLLGGISGGFQGASNGRIQRNKEIKDIITKGETTNKNLGEYIIPDEARANIDARNEAQKALEAAQKSNKSPSIVRKLQVKVQEAEKAVEDTLPDVIKKDKVAKEAIRQGIDDADVAVVKNMSKTDKQQAVKMFQLAQKASENKRVLERPLDMVGESVLKPAKVLAKTLKQNALQLDDVAKGLKGQAIDAQDDVLRGLDDDLINIGASFDDKGKLNFAGSDLEGLGNNEKLIDNVYRRIKSAKDAYDWHRVKRFIDSNVDYGTRAEGLTGQAQKLLKGWRRAIDGALDEQFSDYNKVNTTLSEVIDQLDEVSSVFGKKLDLNDPLAGVRAGQVSSRILSNSPNRGDVLRVLKSMQDVAKKYGYKSNEDVLNQVIFADVLEDIFGTQATRSLRGQVTRAGTDVMGAIETGVDATRGNLLGTVIKGGKAAVDYARGVNNEAKKKALEALLGIGKEAVEESADDAAGVAAKKLGEDLADTAGDILGKKIVPEAAKSLKVPKKKP